MEIRLATPEDLDGLVPIQRQTQQLHQRSFPSYYRSPADENLRAAMNDFLAAEDTVVWVATLDGAPAGFLVFKLVTAEENAFALARREGFIEQLAVDERFRRRGIGRALVRHAEEYAGGQGCNELRLAVLVVNDAARRFYETLGLTPFIERWRKEL